MRLPEKIIINGKSLREILDLHEIWLNTNFVKGERAKLAGVDLSKTCLLDINLSKSHLPSANLFGADLSGSDLSLSNLSGTNLYKANLSNSNLTGSDLTDADFSGSELTGANFEGALLVATVFSNCDLTKVKNLDKVFHFGPSVIDINSIPNLDKLPYLFLKGVGFNDRFINYYSSLFSAGLPIQYYSCFLSYSSKDYIFANRLKSELQNAGLRVWFAPEDLKIGGRIRDEIDRAIMIYDKLMLILSADSISSQWVEGEVESALEKERQTCKAVLFPIRVDNSIFNVNSGWAKLVKNSRHIGDFTSWKDHDSFKKSFDRLLRDLKEEKQP